MSMYSSIEPQGEAFSLEGNEVKHHYKCKVKDYDSEVKIVILHEVEIDFFKSLIHFQTNLGIYDETMKHLWKKFSNYIKYKQSEQESKE